MSDVKHTPGPWRAIQADLHGDEDSPDVNRWSVVVHGDRNYFVATVENGAPGDTLYTEEANAKLMAAAPDLLEACKAALAYIPNSVVRSWPPGFELKAKALELLRSAIAKATGQ